MARRLPFGASIGGCRAIPGRSTFFLSGNCMGSSEHSRTPKRRRRVAQVVARSASIKLRLGKTERGRFELRSSPFLTAPTGFFQRLIAELFANNLFNIDGFDDRNIPQTIDRFDN